MDLFLIFLWWFFILLSVSVIMSLIDWLIFYFVSRYKDGMADYRKVNIFPIMMVSNFQAIFVFIIFSFAVVFFGGFLLAGTFLPFIMGAGNFNFSVSPFEHTTSFSSFLMWAIFVLWPFSYALRFKINTVLWRLRGKGKLIEGTSRYVSLLSSLSMILFFVLLIFIQE